MPRNRGSNRSLLCKVCDSTAAKLIGLAAAIVSLSSPHKQPPGVKEAGLVVLPVAVWSGTNATPTHRPTRRSTVQSSSGAQSPNVSGVQHDVKIQYEQSAVVATEGSPQNASPSSPTSSARPGSTIQNSRGAQSPNVSGIGGSVDIRYGSTPSEKESPRGAK
jgi:hypothetical protein